MVTQRKYTSSLYHNTHNYARLVKRIAFSVVRTRAIARTHTLKLITRTATYNVHAYSNRSLIQSIYTRLQMNGAATVGYTARQHNERTIITAHTYEPLNYCCQVGSTVKLDVTLG